MKKVIGILYGGKSAEHEISLMSAKNVFDAIDKDKFEPSMIKIDKSGQWETKDFSGFDAIFPILHGPFGEDGTVQGLLKLADIPFVGPGVLGSAVGMDKDVMKRLLNEAGFHIGRYLVVKSHENIPSYTFALSVLSVRGTQGGPVFVKPANMGSSVGISKVDSEEEYFAAVEEAFKYDTKIILEEFVPGREIECAVLGNENPIASLPGEVIPADGFYSYKAKYIDEKGAALEIPAKLDKSIIKEIQQTAIRVFQTLCCEGLSRVDFFLKDDGRIFVNEINTIPGFTKISMYPKLFEASGIPYTELITRLIELAIARHEKERKLKTSVV